MKASCVVNSEGEVIDTRSLLNVFSVKNLQARVSELDALVKSFVELLQKHGYCAAPDCFVYKVQPFYTEDRILLLYKVPLEAKHPFVWQANFLKHKNELSPQMRLTDSEISVIRSIYSEQHKQRVLWYARFVQEIVLERNVYDCRWECFSPLKPVTIFDYENRAAESLITREQLRSGTGNKAYFYPKDGELPDFNTAYETALSVQTGLEQESIEPVIRAAMLDLYAMYGFNGKKKYANQALFCLFAINDLKYSGRMYQLYITLRERIKAEIPAALRIRYEACKIIFEDSGTERTIFVRDGFTQREQFAFVTNGYIFSDIDSLINGLKQPFEPCLWFESVVLPNVISSVRKDTQYGEHRN